MVQLKPKSERDVGGQQVIARLRAPLGLISGVTTFLSPVQDLRMGARQSNANYQFTLKGDDIAELNSYTTKLTDAIQPQPHPPHIHPNPAAHPHPIKYVKTHQ